MCIFQMLLQFRCVTKSIITMAASLAFYPLCILKCVFETACFSLHLFEFSPLCFKMCPQMPNLRECVIALASFMQLSLWCVFKCALS